MSHSEALSHSGGREPGWSPARTPLAADDRPPLCVLDRDLRCVHVNAALARLSGRELPAHVGRTLADLLPPLAFVLEPLCRRVVATGQPIADVDVRVAVAARPGGEERWHASVVPRFDDDAVTIGAAVLLREPMDVDRLEQELADRRQFEGLLAELSVAFIGAPEGAIDRRIRAGLARMVAALDVDAGVLAEIDGDAPVRARIAHWQGRPGVSMVLPETADAAFPWLVGEMTAGRLVRCTGADDLPGARSPTASRSTSSVSAPSSRARWWSKAASPAPSPSTPCAAPVTGRTRSSSACAWWRSSSAARSHDAAPTRGSPRNGASPTLRSRACRQSFSPSTRTAPSCDGIARPRR
jgi:hypothetical protein